VSEPSHDYPYGDSAEAYDVVVEQILVSGTSEADLETGSPLPIKGKILQDQLLPEKG
jgi:hypothetical protein